MRVLVAALGGCALIITGCSGGSDPAGTPPIATRASAPATAASRGVTTSAAPSSPAPTSASRGTVIKVADSQFGTILFDRSGQAIYLFDKETTNHPECYGACAEAWPPVLAGGVPTAAAGVLADALGTTRRRDGTTQVTYAGHPLYYYAHEGKNEVLCHNVREYGGLWLVITPTGKAAPHYANGRPALAAPSPHRLVVPSVWVPRLSTKISTLARTLTGPA
jgi:predicted lipoprotein with Yx(FWY)xxD motif